MATLQALYDLQQALARPLEEVDNSERHIDDPFNEELTIKAALLQLEAGVEQLNPFYEATQENLIQDEDGLWDLEEEGEDEAVEAEEEATQLFCNEAQWEGEYDAALGIFAKIIEFVDNYSYLLEETVDYRPKKEASASEEEELNPLQYRADDEERFIKIPDPTKVKSQATSAPASSFMSGSPLCRSEEKRKSYNKWKQQFKKPQDTQSEKEGIAYQSPSP